jgi:DNA-3-methyladenine glycosylase I
LPAILAWWRAPTRANVKGDEPAMDAASIRIGEDGLARCAWGASDALYATYHDEEWGVPVYDDRALFERLMLEGFQAGLSWRTILAKRDNFFRAFDGWDPERIAAYGPDDLARLLADPGIVRNRLKVEGAVKNARAYLAVRAERGSFADYLWSFVGGAPLARPRPAALAEIPVSTPQSDAMSKDLRRRGFTFVGTTICYAFMQSVGMVDDHVSGCFRAGA